MRAHDCGTHECAPSVHLDTQPAAAMGAVHAASLLVHALPTEGTLARVACWARPGCRSAVPTVAPRAVNKTKGGSRCGGLSHCPAPDGGEKKAKWYLRCLALKLDSVWIAVDWDMRPAYRSTTSRVSNRTLNNKSQRSISGSESKAYST